MAEALLKLLDISKYYASKDAVTLGLRKVNVEFRRGEFVAITGESGSGKSTLLNVLSGIDSYEDGEMYFNGGETSCFTRAEWDEYRRKNIAFVFQDYSLIDSYTVLQNVELSLYDNYPDRKDRRRRALELLDKVGLLSHKRHKCTKLSGGQKQRVAIARALAKDAPIILADEPTGNLDSTTSDAIIKLMAETAKDKLLIMVTHNYDDVEGVATRKIRMYDGSVAEDKTITPPPENAKGDDVKEVGEDDKKRFKGAVPIAVNNLLATPKRSLFILSTSFIATLLIAVFLFGYINIIVPPSDANLMGDRRDSMYVIEKDRQDLTSANIEALQAINGVEGVLTDYGAYNMNFTPKEMIWDNVNYVYELNMKILTTANYGKKTPAHGRLPENDNEIMLGWSNKGKPNLDLIGKEVELVLLGPNDWYYEGMLQDEYNRNLLYFKRYTVTGFDVKGFCYITPSALESLSIEYDNNKIPQMNIEIEGYKDYDDINKDYFSGAWSMNTKIIADDTVANNVVYFLYNPEEGINELWEIGNLFENGTGEQHYNEQTGQWESSSKAKEIYIKFLYNPKNYNARFTVLPATPHINSEVYNAHKDAGTKPMLVMRGSNNPYGVTSSKSTALVIMSQGSKADNVIAALNDAGYKVIYPYGKPLSIIEIIIRLVNQLTGLITGLIVITIAVALISEVYSRVSKSKKKDFNILRTVGLSTSIIKNINYAEFIIINILAFTLTFLTFVGFVIIGKVTGNANIINAVNSLLPFGPLHIQSLMVYAGVFAMLMLLTIWIAKKFNAKMFKTTVKKSLTETA